MYPVHFTAVLQFLLKWPYVQFNPSSLIPVFMLNISIFKLKIHLCEIINRFFLSLFIMQSFTVCVFFRQDQIVWRYQCVKHPNWNKVFTDDINRKRDHRDIHKKNQFHCSFIYRYWSVYWVYLSIILCFYWLWVSSLQFVQFLCKYLFL